MRSRRSPKEGRWRICLRQGRRYPPHFHSFIPPLLSAPPPCRNCLMYSTPQCTDLDIITAEKEGGSQGVREGEGEHWGVEYMRQLRQGGGADRRGGMKE